MSCTRFKQLLVLPFNYSITSHLQRNSSSLLRMQNTKYSMATGSSSPMDKVRDEGSQRLSGVMFDMDGTLTVPYLNFRQLKQDLAMPLNEDVLAYVSSLPESEKKRAYDIIEAFEEDGLKNLQFQPGFYHLFEFLSKKTVLKRGLITRNNQRAVDFFLERATSFKGGTGNGKAPHFSTTDLFDKILTRDFQPVKPAPDPILHLCAEWNISPSHSIFVGDNMEDMMCGKAAGAWTILVKNNSNGSALKLADYSVDTLCEIIQIMSDNFSFPQGSELACQDN